MKKIFTLTLLAVCFSTFLFAQSSSLWGTCGWGGAQNWGTIVKGNSDGTDFHSVYSFDNTNGAEPVGGLCMADNGRLYGVTWLGGYGDSCVCFEYDTLTGVYTKFYDLFLDMTQGWDAWSGMTKTADGMLYGLCAAGGLNNGGVIYRIDPNTDTYNAVYHLTTATGSSPYGGMITLSDGNLYGLTSYGGANNAGTIFRYDAGAGTYTDLYDLNPATGQNPWYGSLLKANDGLLYGMTYMGGASLATDINAMGSGAIFSYDLNTGTYTDIFDLDSAHGSHPYGGLMQADNGLLYGMTYDGGEYNKGVIFSIDPLTHAYTVLHSFDGTDGANPQRNLSQTGNGKLYGVASTGGANSGGTFFNFDIVTNTFTKLLDCSAATGTAPSCDILETRNRAEFNSVGVTASANELTVYPSPASKEISVTGNAITVNTPVTVTDVFGKEVMQLTASKTHEVILNISTLAAGVYFVNVKTALGTSVKRFVKE